MCVVFVIPVCALHMSDLCVCMRDVILEFNSEVEGSLAFCALMLFLCSIFCLMCPGSRSSVCEYQSVECAFTSPVSIESGLLVTCRIQCAMSVSTGL